MPFTKGNSGNPSGRPKGASNKLNKELRECLAKAIDNNKVSLMLNQIDEPIEYINAISKLLPYVVGKMKQVDTEMEEIEPIVINIQLDDSDEEK